MKSKLFLILIFLPFCSKSSDKSLLKFDPRTLDELIIPLSQIADNITYIPLDNSFPLGPINTASIFKFTKKSIYFSMARTGILEFNRDGKFIRNIGKIGRGPGEYNSSSRFSFDENSEIIYVLDRAVIGKPIKAYSHNGDFLKSVTLPDYCDNIQTIEFFNSKFLAFNYQTDSLTKFNWVVFDTLGKIVTRKPRTIPMFMSGWGGSFGTYKFGNNLYYWDTYNDTVFSIFPDFKYNASFIISPGEHRAPRAHIPNPFLLQQYMSINQIFETNHFWVISYFYKKQVLVLITKENSEVFVYNLESEQTSFGSRSKGGIGNDVDGGPLFFPQNYFEENGREYMVGLINPYEVKSYTKSSEFKNVNPKYPEKKKELEMLANRLKETDNPVIVIVRLKK